MDSIRTLYGPTIARFIQSVVRVGQDEMPCLFRELLPVDIEDAKLGFQLHGQVTNANFSTKKCIFLVFINRTWNDMLVGQLGFSSHFCCRPVGGMYSFASCCRLSIRCLSAKELPSICVYEVGLLLQVYVT